MFTAPTALRAIRREDPENKFFEAAAAGGALKNLRALFLAGERSEPSIVRQYQTLLEKHCAPKAQVIDVSITVQQVIRGVSLTNARTGGLPNLDHQYQLLH